MPVFRKILIIVACIGLAACQKPPQEDVTALELRTYDVPPGTVRPLISMIKDALWMDEHKVIGRATQTPDGRLAVMAPKNVQVGVERLVQEISKHPPTFAQSIELQYWVVQSRPAQAPDAVPPGLREIQPALDEIARSQGPQTFTLADRARLVSINDEEAQVQASRLKVLQNAVQTGDGVYAHTKIHYQENAIETQLHLQPDQIVILGAAGQHGADSEGSTLYYVVRLSPHSHGQHP